MESFFLLNTPKVYLGKGARERLFTGEINIGRNIVWVTGGASLDGSEHGKSMVEKMNRSPYNAKRVYIRNEPSPEDIDTVVDEIGNMKIDTVIAVGGGSVIDAGKAISAMLPLKEPVMDYLEGVGTQQHPGHKIPFIALPTTSGTGSEATKNAVITKSGENGFKKSLRHDNFVPNIAILDPELMLSCPPETTAAVGMDAFTQLLESYLSTKATPFTNALALDGMAHIVRSLERAVNYGDSIEAREGMAYAAYLSGVTLANAGLGVVHGFAQPLGSLFSIPHSVVCGTLVATVNDITLKHVLAHKGPGSVIEKYAELGKLVSGLPGHSEELAHKGIEYLKGLEQKLNFPKLSGFGVGEEHFEAILQNTGQKNHPLLLSKDDLKLILRTRL